MAFATRLLMTIADHYRRLQNELAGYPRARLLAVVKKRTPTEIQTVIDAGVDKIAFNTVQEAEAKLPLLDFAGETHLIGRLQSNKARKAVRLFAVIASVDRWELAVRLDAIAAEAGKTQRVLVQVNTAADPAKAGFFPEVYRAAAPALAEFQHLRVEGLMTIGRLGAAEAETAAAFAALRALFDETRDRGLFGDPFRELSMGMSGDYPLALKAGATLVRVGSALFENP
jgi:pyridoxal phosphate enzyme (YggS family)